MEKKYHTVGTGPKSNIKIIERCPKNIPSVGRVPKSNTCIKIVERDKIDTRTYKIHDRSLFWQGTGPSIKSGGVKLVLRAPKPPFLKISTYY